MFCYYNQPLYLYWQPEATFYVLSLTTSIVFISEDRSVLECESSFFTHYKLDNTLKFTFDTIPIHVRNACYSLQTIASICKEFQSLVVKTENKEEFVEEEMLDGIKFENEVEELGSFIAYNDKSIRVLFNDRTLIRIYSDFTVSAISRSGEAARFSLENPFGFENYIPVCVEFYNWAFMSQADQTKRANEALERENMVMAEINRVERLNNKVPQSPVVVDEDIAITLMNTKKQIEETQMLLIKIHNIKK